MIHTFFGGLDTQVVAKHFLVTGLASSVDFDTVFPFNFSSETFFARAIAWPGSRFSLLVPLKDR